MEEKRIVLIRHEQTIENQTGIIQGQLIGGTLASLECDPYRIAWLKNHHIENGVLISSDTNRAHQSALRMSRALGVPIETCSLLRQRSWGSAEGQSKHLLRGAILGNAYLTDANHLYPGAESLQEVTKRAKIVWSYLSTRPERTIFVCTHDEFSNYIVNEALQEGLFRRHLLFNEGHLLDIGDGIPQRVDLHSSMSIPPIKKYVVVRRDAHTFLAYKLGRKILQNRGIELIGEDITIDPSRIEGIVIGDDTFDDNDLTYYPNIKVISRFGKGFNNVQVSRRENLYVTNTPGCNEIAAAQFTVALINSLAHSIQSSQSLFFSSEWTKVIPRTPPEELCIGIVGLGHIGQEVARQMKKLGCKVIAWTVHPKLHLDFIKQQELQMCDSVKELCEEADIVSLHTRASKKTNNLVGVKELQALASHRGFIVNISRATILDYQTVSKLIEEKKLSGAALDVWPEEPIKSDWLFKLAKNHLVIATPHIAGKQQYALERAVATCAYNVAWILNGSPHNASVVPWTELE